ncbi:hypothetical protein HYG81_11340 [Natrinema zhouii]|uniref:Uncharacterized protein n=1 Tax=Natrinema zhouii TaxID=1710539 RepID=A0A7D6CP30_9EURY|nr:hypothetical protein [Natrinema zhouii]QLK24713.1 hypothetical protein HYG81_11340 [Natrinema zhouii]
MNRRQYLTRTVAAGASTGTLAGLAGCLGGLTDTSDANEVTVSDRTGERALSRAAGSLNKAAQSLDELEGLENPEDIDFDPQKPHNHLSAAREHLDTAESELGDDRESDIETLRSYADAVDGLITVTATITDDTLADDIEAVNAVLEEEGDLEEANETVDDRNETVTGARERHEEVTATIDAIDGDRLAELSGIDLADLEDGAATLGDAVISLETLTRTYDATLDGDDGYGALERGREYADDGEYEAAQAEFETAEATFAASLDRLEAGRSEAPEGFVDYFETASCQNGHLRDAAGAFAESAAAAADRNPVAAESYKKQGEDSLDAVGSCSN